MQTVVGTDIEVPPDLVLHTLDQGSWPWLFQELTRMVEHYRTVPLDPVLLFWPMIPGREGPALADGDTGALSESLLRDDRYELRLVSRREGEFVCRTWPVSRGYFEPARLPLKRNDDLKPLTRPTPRSRRSPFDPR